MTPIGHSGAVFLAMLVLLNVGVYARSQETRTAAGVLLVLMGIVCGVGEAIK